MFEVPDVDFFSGPVELLFLLCFIALWTLLVSVIVVVCSLCPVCFPIVSECVSVLL